MYEGVAWYYKEFELNDTKNALVKLVFKGVNYKATVYVNGKYVGVHESGYTEFFFDLFCKADMCGVVFGNDKNTGGVAVDAVNNAGTDDTVDA